MRNLAIALGLVVSLVALTACSNKCYTCKEATTTTVTHHDLKGEIVKK